LFAIYWAFAIKSHINIGHRHILPTYPAMLILAGGAWSWTKNISSKLNRSKDAPLAKATEKFSLAGRCLTICWPPVIVLTCAAWFVAESLLIWPNYLTYFNQLAGGPRHGYRHVVDSSLDWGQDLPGLKNWIEDERHADGSSRNIYVSYFGTGNPGYYGIDVTLLTCLPPRPQPKVGEDLQPGTYCISATMLQSVYPPFPGHWNRDYEAEYQRLRSLVHKYQQSTPELQKQLIAADGRDYWDTAAEHYTQAQFSRLLSYVRQREPDDEINYSILVFRVTRSDLTRALDGPPLQLEDSSEP
jgi:hypothetical protein